AQVRVDVLLCGVICLGAGLLLGHQLVETSLVDRQRGFLSHLAGQIDREAVGVVQREGHFAWNNRVTTIASFTKELLEKLGSGLEGFQEGLFLGHSHGADTLPVLLNFWVARGQDRKSTRLNSSPVS